MTEIQCKDPDTFANVNYRVSTHSVGGVAQYYCPRGHMMQGNSTRICLKKGVWGGQAPSCLRKLTFKPNVLDFSPLYYCFSCGLWTSGLYRQWQGDHYEWYHVQQRH